MTATHWDALGTLLSSTRALFEAAACSCALTSADGESLTFVAADGAGADEIVGVSIPVTAGIAGWVALSGQPTAIAEAHGDERFAREVAEATSFVPSAIMAVPMVDPRGEIVGVVELLDPRRRELDLGVLAVVASHVETVVRLQNASAVGADPQLIDLAQRLARSQLPLARSLIAALVKHGE